MELSGSQRAGVHHHEDRPGTAHPGGLGVAHLEPEGRSTFLDDWWLPADWSRQICLPEHGTFFAEDPSASGSTLFVAGRPGELHTRLHDLAAGRFRCRQGRP